MRYRILDILVCPQCGSCLQVIPLDFSTLPSKPLITLKPPLCETHCSWAEQAGKKLHNCHECITSEIDIGILQCNQGHFFPIVNSVPRMLPDAINSYLSELSKFKSKLPSELWKKILACAPTAAASLDRDFSHTRSSFSSEWASINENDSAWGRSIEARKKLFLDSFGIEETSLLGKKVLDAGCGHGEVEQAIAPLGAEVFAMDLSNSVGYVASRLRSLGAAGMLTHIVQGNVHTPPFKNIYFDFVYSAGVLHHTPDTFFGFKQITGKVKPGGQCFIEVYSNELKNWLEYTLYILFFWMRKITVWMPHPILHAVCAFIAPFFWLYITIFNTLRGKKRYSTRSIREVKLSLFDALSPRYDWHHTTPEVTDWFLKLGYADVHKTFENQNGFGIVGTIPISR